MSGSDWLGGFDDSYGTSSAGSHHPSGDPSHDTPTPSNPRRNGAIICCPHCRSIDIHIRSTTAFGDRVQFRCKACNKHFTETLPGGACRVYIASPKEPQQ